MNKKLLLPLFFFIVAGCHPSPQPSLLRVEVFKRLPGNRLASWQVDAASLRHSLIPLPKDMDGVDLVSGILTPDRKILRINEPSLAPRGSNGPTPDTTGIPSGAQFWMVADPKAFPVDATHPFELTFGKTSIELPTDLVSRATRIIVWGNASTLGADMTLDAEYQDASDAARLAPSLSAVLHLARDIKSDTSAQGTHIVIHASIGPVDAGRLLLSWTNREKP